MDFPLDALDEIAARIFDSVAHLLNLDVDIVFVDTTSTYWEVDGADEWADLRPCVLAANVCPVGIVKLFGNACGAVDVSGPAGKR